MTLAVVLVSVAAVVVGYLLVSWLRKPAARNPFATDSRQPLRPLVVDQKLRDKVLKQCKYLLAGSASRHRSVLALGLFVQLFEVEYSCIRECNAFKVS